VGIPIVRQINGVTIIGLLKSGAPLVLKAKERESTKVGMNQICSFLSEKWSLQNTDVELKKEGIHCELGINFEVNSKLLEIQLFPIAFNTYKEKETFPAKKFVRSKDRFLGKLPPWAQTLLKTVIPHVVIFGLKHTPAVGPLFDVLISGK